MKEQHAHAVGILENTSRFLVLLVIPVVRALLAGGSLQVWLAGSWMDLLVIACILLLGVVLWARFTYLLTDDGIRIRRGLFLRRQLFLPYHRLTVVKLEEPFYLRPIHAIRLRADTDAGFPAAPDFSVTLSRTQALRLMARTHGCITQGDPLKRVYLPRSLYIAVLSYVSSNSLSGVLFTAALISGAGKLLGTEFEQELVRQLTDVMRFLAFGLPPIAAVVAFLLLGGWLVAFAVNTVRHLRFCVTRQGGSLHIRRGVVTRQNYDITVERINLVELRQTLLTWLFGVFSVFIHANGYGKGKDELTVVMPSSSRENLKSNLTLLLPEFSFGPNRLRPRLKYLSRFLIPPLWYLVGVTAGWMLCFRLLPGFRPVILFIGLLAECPCFTYLLVKLAAYRHTGLSLKNGMLTCRCTYAYSIKTLSIPMKRVIKVTLRRSLFQVISGCCDVVILTVAEGRKRIVVPNLPFRETERLFRTDRFPPVSLHF